MALLVDSEVLRRQVRGALKNAVDQHGAVDRESVARVADLVVAQLEAMDRNFIPTDDKKLRKVRALEERDGPGCHYCGVVLDWWAYTFDHDLPKSRGGTRALANLRLACRSCNNAKGSLTGDEYRAALTRRAATRRPRQRDGDLGDAFLDELAARREDRARFQRLTQLVADARGADALLSGFAPAPGSDPAR